jgi:NAD(P)-dependent dehydrogenase (short-subunit alcohol dehydrogenase family)
VVANAEELGGIRYALSNAGVARRVPLHQMTLQDWAVVVETHLTGTFHVCQALLARMVQRRRGGIVITSSDFAVIGMPGAANYAAAKTALYSLTKSLALEFAPHIRVNAVGPGPIDTPLLHVGRTQAEWEELASSYEARLPLRRLGDPDEVASVVEFLFSDRSAYITGQLLQPNGGQVMW